jgi:dTDP-glucose pyrophosphorylase
MEEYTRYTVQVYNDDKYCRAWVDQHTATQLEQAVNILNQFKKQKYETCPKARIVERIIKDTVMIETPLELKNAN